jgi:hypothetical protein
VFFDCLDISVRYSRCFVFLGLFISLGISVLQGWFGVRSISFCVFSFGLRVILQNVRFTLYIMFTHIHRCLKSKDIELQAPSIPYFVR